MNLLEINNLETYYGPVMAIRGVSLNVPQGAIVTLLGGNGAGKTTVVYVVTDIKDQSKEGSSPSKPPSEAKRCTDVQVT